MKCEVAGCQSPAREAARVCFDHSKPPTPTGLDREGPLLERGRGLTPAEHSDVSMIQEAHRLVEQGGTEFGAYVAAHGDRGVLLRIIDRLISEAPTICADDYEPERRGLAAEKPRPATIPDRTPVQGADRPTGADHFMYIVLRQLETDPPEVFPFRALADAEDFYERAQLQWTGVYLCRILRAADRQLDEQPPAEGAVRGQDAPPVLVAGLTEAERREVERAQWVAADGVVLLPDSFAQIIRKLLRIIDRLTSGKEGT